MKIVVKAKPNSKIESVVTFDPVPKEQEESSTPCGTCRVFIWESRTPNTTIICGQYIQRKNGWEFVPKMEKYAIKELYPKPHKMVKWN